MNYYVSLIENLKKLSNNDKAIRGYALCRLLGEDTFNQLFISTLDINHINFSEFYLRVLKNFRQIDCCQDVFRITKNEKTELNQYIDDLWYDFLNTDSDFIYKEIYRLVKDKFPNENIKLNRTV